MSRKEIQELEKALQDFDEIPTDTDGVVEGEELNLSILEQNPEFLKD